MSLYDDIVRTLHKNRSKLEDLIGTYAQGYLFILRFF